MPGADPRSAPLPTRGHDPEPWDAARCERWSHPPCPAMGSGPAGVDRVGDVEHSVGDDLARKHAHVVSTFPWSPRPPGKHQRPASAVHGCTQRWWPCVPSAPAAAARRIFAAVHRPRFDVRHHDRRRAGGSIPGAEPAAAVQAGGQPRRHRASACHRASTTRSGCQRRRRPDRRHRLADPAREPEGSGCRSHPGAGGAGTGPIEVMAWRTRHP